MLFDCRATLGFVIEGKNAEDAHDELMFIIDNITQDTYYDIDVVKTEVVEVGD